jgi:hypothetical protein
MVKYFERESAAKVPDVIRVADASLDAELPYVAREESSDGSSVDEVAEDAVKPGTGFLAFGTMMTSSGTSAA